jgi:hypothetical protein
METWLDIGTAHVVVVRILLVALVFAIVLGCGLLEKDRYT